MDRNYEIKIEKTEKGNCKVREMEKVERRLRDKGDKGSN